MNIDIDIALITSHANSVMYAELVFNANRKFDSRIDNANTSLWDHPHPLIGSLGN